MNNISKVSVVIVNYYTSAHVEKLLASFLKLNLINKLEIIIVDNSENDYNLKEILLNYNTVKYILSSSNDGFGAACNVGVANSSGEFIAFVNPDIIFVSDIFDELINFVEINKNTGFVGCLLMNEKTELLYSYNFFPGYYWEFLQALGIGSNREINMLLNRKEVTVSHFPFEVDWLIGAFLFVSRKVLDELKGFDERFFLYYEDVDIQFRAKQLGFKNYCIPNLKLMHFEQGSVKSEKGDDIYHFYMYKSKMMYYYLHFPFIKRNILRMFLLIGLFLRVIFLLPRKSFGNKKKKFKQYKYMFRYFMGNKKIVFENKRI